MTLNDAEAPVIEERSTEEPAKVDGASYRPLLAARSSELCDCEGALIVDSPAKS